jgi:PAS domain S-box-containing protein
MPVAMEQVPEDFGVGRLFWAIREAVIVADAGTGRIALWNPAAEALLGYSAAEALALTVDALVPDRLRDRHRAGFARYDATGHGPLVDAGTPVEVPARRKDGAEVPIELTLTPLDTAAGRYVLAFLRDLTERRRVEAARLQVGREQAARAAAERAGAERAATLQQLTDGVIVADDAGRITFVNAAARDLHGVAELGVGVAGYSATYHLLTPDGLPFPPEELPLARAVLRGETVVDAEWRIRRPDGSEIVAQGGAAPITGADGARHGAVLTLRDVTARRVLERQKDALLAARDQALAEAEAARGRLAFLARASASLAASLDVAATLRDLTRLLVPEQADWCAVDLVAADGALDRLAAAHRDPAKEPLLHEMGRRYPPAAAEPSPIRGVLRGGRSLYLPDIADAALPGLTRDAEHLALVRAIGLTSGLVVPLQARGRILGALSLTRIGSRHYGSADLALAEDLGRRAALALDNARLYQEAQAAIGARDHFLTVAAHELRTPITSIRGYAELLLRRQARGHDSPERQAQGLATISEAAGRLGRLTADLLDVSRLRTGQLSFRPRPLDLAALAAEAADRHRGGLGRQYRLTVERPAEPCPVLADADRLEQVLANLLENAAKYSPDGGAIGLTVAPESGGVALRVRDEGIGLPIGAAAALFVPFARAPNATRRHLPGLGLGLAICRDIVERHGGRIWAESDGEGRGTTLGFWLPAAPPPAAISVPTAAPLA